MARIRKKPHTSAASKAAMSELSMANWAEVTASLMRLAASSAILLLVSTMRWVSW
uniref:hypothetical protein n=1 Tax=Herbaspirillum camelliae TaxID=1892903 RepID=UPI003899200A